MWKEKSRNKTPMKNSLDFFVITYLILFYNLKIIKKIYHTHTHTHTDTGKAARALIAQLFLYIFELGWHVSALDAFDGNTATVRYTLTHPPMFWWYAVDVEWYSVSVLPHAFVRFAFHRRSCMRKKKLYSDQQSSCI